MVDVAQLVAIMRPVALIILSSLVVLFLPVYASEDSQDGSEAQPQAEAPPPSEAPAQTDQEVKPEATDQDEKPAEKKPMMLQGSANVAVDINQGEFGTRAAVHAAQLYREGVAYLSGGNFAAAANLFRQAGFGFAAAAGNGRFLADTCFAEAQSRRFLRENAQAAQLYAWAVDLFNTYNPSSPYLKAAAQFRDKLGGKALTAKVSMKKPLLKARHGQIDMIASTVSLQGKAVELDDGTDLSTLKDEEVFEGKQLPRAFPLNISDTYLHDQMYKAFLKMNCQEFAALGGNYYTAPDLYKGLKASGKNIAIGASDEFWGPVVHLSVKGREYGITMDLPDMAKGSHNVLLVTDGQHVLAIDPRNQDTWRLVISDKGARPEFSWFKLTHIK